MRIHIVGICGTFMAGLAVLAKQLGHTVSGSDKAFNPPMSLQLKSSEITLIEEFHPEQLPGKPDLVIIGNALSRGDKWVEWVLDEHIPYTSGPQWLAEVVLPGRHVIVWSATHGKTTSTTLLTFLMKKAGVYPGYLIGGLSPHFPTSADLGTSPYFIIEGDEYDSAFFDKRPKFLHYRPDTLVINNIELDHVDIYANLEEIIRQFHYLVRTVPRSGVIIAPSADSGVQKLKAFPHWSRWVEVDQEWRAEKLSASGEYLRIFYQGKRLGEISWQLLGQHNCANLLSVLATLQELGIRAPLEALPEFQGAYKRMQYVGERRGVTFYEDFAHHPTAIELTLQGMRSKIGSQPLIAIVDFGSNTMKMGIHNDRLPSAFSAADRIFLFTSTPLQWSMEEFVKACAMPTEAFSDPEQLIQRLEEKIAPGATVVIMSNQSGQPLTRLLELSSERV